MAQVNENPGVLLYSADPKSPYFYASRRHGVQLYSIYNHTYHPRHYGDPVEEYWQLLNGVTLWDVAASSARSRSAGPDAFDFTNLLVARDLNKCEVGQCKYVFTCLPDGGIINDPVLLRVEENRFWLSLADSDVELWARGVAYNSGYDVTIKEIDVGPVQVQGPKSKDVMVDLFGESILEIPYYFLRPYELDGHEGARLAHRLHRRARLRDLSVRGDEERREALGRGARGGQAARPRGDRALPHPPHRGRHPRRPAATCGSTRTPTRSAWATTGWSTSSRARTSSARTPSRKIKRDGPEAQAGGRRDRRRAAGLLQRRRDDRRLPGAQGRRPRSARSRRRAGRRGWRRTSASRWCRPSTPGSAPSSRSSGRTGGRRPWWSRSPSSIPRRRPRSRSSRQRRVVTPLSTSLHVLSGPLDDERRGGADLRRRPVRVQGRAPRCVEAVRHSASELIPDAPRREDSTIDELQEEFRRDPRVDTPDARRPSSRWGWTRGAPTGTRPACASCRRSAPPSAQVGTDRLPPRHLGRRTCSQQTNWWLTLRPLTDERTIAFYPEYWSKPIANTSAEWDLAEIRERRRARRAGSTTCRSCPSRASRRRPSSELRMVIEPGDLLCFSGAHLHASVPNVSDRARVCSVELRTVNRDDLAAWPRRARPGRARRRRLRSSGSDRWWTATPLTRERMRSSSG